MSNYLGTLWVTMYQVVLALLLLNLSTVSFAATTKPPEPMKITSDASTVDKTKGIATFTGHVDFVQGTTKVTGDKMVVYFDKNNQLQKVVVTGNFAKAWISPNASKSQIVSQAQTITYEPAKGVVQLAGQAEANQNGNIMRGPLLIYNTQTQVLTSSQGADANGRTVIILQPKGGETIIPSILPSTPTTPSSTRSTTP